METSFDKYFPDNQDYINIIDNDHITIDASAFIECEINSLNINGVLEEIKTSLSTVDKKEKNKSKIICELYENDKHINLLNILNDIIAFNVQNATHEEIKDFVSNLKDKTNETLLKMFL